MPNFTVDTEKGRIWVTYDTREELEAFLKKRFKHWEIKTREKSELNLLIEEIKKDPEGEFYCYGHSRTTLYYALMHTFGRRTYSITPHGDQEHSYVIRSTAKYFGGEKIDLSQFKHVESMKELLREIQRNTFLYTEHIDRNHILYRLKGKIKTKRLGKGILIQKIEES